MRILCVLLIIAFQGPAFALSKAQEHPVIKPMPRSQLVPAQSRTKNYASHQFRVKKLRVEIQGHTDNTGSADHNMDLSTRRAETVKKFLLVFGIEASRMVSKGYGQEKPVASNDMEEGRAMNRRVELINIK